MSILYVLIPLALGLLAIAVWALLWAIRTGQFDDLESHGWSVVLDDDQKPMPMADDVVDEPDEMNVDETRSTERQSDKAPMERIQVTGESASVTRGSQPEKPVSGKNIKQSSE